MIREPLSKPVQDIVNILRTMIDENEATEERKAVHSWKYGGAKFLYGMNQLKATLESEGKKVPNTSTPYFTHYPSSNMSIRSTNAKPCTSPEAQTS